MLVTVQVNGRPVRQEITFWQVRRINAEGIMDNHKRWLVQTSRNGWGRVARESIEDEIRLAKRLVLDNFNDPDFPLEGNGWELTVDVVEFEVKGQVAVL